jgi:hypothetical protein
MSQRTGRKLAAVALAGLTAAVLVAAPAPTETTDTIKERKGFIPNRVYHALPGKTVGILVSDVGAMMLQEGRGGPPDAYGFSRDLGSYNWMYAPDNDKPIITNLTIKVGEKGDQTKTYPKLNMANPKTVKQWNIDAPYALIDVEVNDGLGCPADEHFTATNMKRLDGTKEYPLVLPDVVKELKERYKKYKEEQSKALDAALDDSQKAAIKDKKPTGPRETKELFYLTWLPKEEKVRVHFRTTVSDGAYQTVTVPGFPGGPIPLPPPPGGPIPPQLNAAFPPPPPPPRQVQYGTTFGIEYGMAYEVDKSGKVDRVLTLPAEAFQKEIPPPQGVKLPAADK